ncbi:MAG: TonB-dependent receptor [Opitutaceae bacterium]|nr:TonB-dependent receptor [Cytophagales bacterium]
MKTIYLAFTAFLFSISLFAQTSLIKGKVFDVSNNHPLIGATVLTSKTTGTTTDHNGEFSFECTDSMGITVSYIGYKAQTQISKCNEILIGLHPSDVHLEEVEITATSNSNKAILYQPESIVKLNEVELKRGTGLFLDDAINSNVPGVFMERRSVAAGQQFNIRGYGNGARGTNGVNSNFDGQGSKVYLNNIPITDAEGITLMDDIDFNSINNVEVIKGPAGSLYGLAIAGVVNLQTKKAEKDKVSIGQNSQFGNYGLQRFTTSLQIGGEKSSLLVNYGNQKSKGFMIHNASHKDFVNVLGDFTLNPKQSLTSYLGYSNSYDERAGELTVQQYENKDYSGNPSYIKNNAHSQIISLRAGLGHTYKFTENIANTTTVFGSGVSNDASSAGGWTDKKPLNYGLRSTINMNFKLGKRLGLSSITGVELQSQHAQIIGYSMVPDSSNLGNYNVIGAMKSNQATISSTSSVFTEWTLALPHEFSITAGVGVSNMSIELNDRFYVATNNNPKNQKGTHNPTNYKTSYNYMISPRFAVNKVFSKQTSVYASYSRGYKAPVSSYFFIPTTGKVNSELKPEVGDQFEIGTKGSLLKDKLVYQLSVFNSIFSNKMTNVSVQNPANTATLYNYVANGGSQDNKGVELLLKYTATQSENGFISAIRPFVNLAYSDFRYVNFKIQSIGKDKINKDSVIKNDYSGNTVAGVPPVTANVGFDFVTRPGLYANASFNYRDAMPFTSDGLNKTTAYSLINGKIGFQKMLFKHLDLNIYAGGDNLTNTQYFYMVFLNQLPDAYLPAPLTANFYGGINLRYIF